MDDMYRQSTGAALNSSFSNILLTENMGSLPFKVDDSEDMLVYNALRDAIFYGWNPSSDNQVVKTERPYEGVVKRDMQVPRKEVVQYKGVRRRPWGSYLLSLFQQSKSRAPTRRNTFLHVDLSKDVNSVSFQVRTTQANKAK
ncbi:ethylene-responsive transcription factor 13-like [Mangifera indica]|uniref:ethylene-responsive transcription factor 13-like n=1 Tax=Mangifera indica TaxID=29780 RepID=UPI001CF9B197|nr:ethylene-responsive transcription factor 13-like [Mangifera indica]XP_044492785.1 ethylene-responsive transcription factor 13-like [Mangifera indica]XP_044492787.1 ethylene-responsive transcription factor 13-like [Mangifera indica]